MSHNKNILLCAYACEPNKGSEPEVGWKTAVYLASEDKESCYTVITRKNNKINIEKEVVPDNLFFIYYDLSNFLLTIKKKGNLVRIYYYLWMLGATLKLWKKRNEFSVIHHITFVNDWLPSLFIFLKTKNNSFIWGPIGSHSPINFKFLNSKKEKFIEIVRIFLQNFFRLLDPIFWLCKKNSTVIIGINEKVKYKLRLNKNKSKKFISIPAIAFNSDKIEVLSSIRNVKKFQIISVGRLMYIKNFKLTLTSFSKLLNLVSEEDRKKIELVIIGEGNQKKELVEIISKLKIEKNVFFKGKLPQGEVMDYYKQSNVFLFPTLESAGFVVLEAMSHGLPIVAMNYGGPKQFILKNRNQQLVSSTNSFDEISNQLSIKLLALFNNIDSRNAIGKENYETVLENFTWQHKIIAILDIYKGIISK